MCKLTFRSLALVICLIAGVGRPLKAQTGYISPKNVLVKATAQVSYDPDTGLYTYQYSFQNDISSLLEVEEILIPLNGSTVLNVTTPRGWTSFLPAGGSKLSFAATEVAPLRPGELDDGLLPPSPYQIKQGQSLSGFSFQSPDPPDFVEFFAQGFTQLPVPGKDVPLDALEDGSSFPNPDDEKFTGIIKGPRFTEKLFLGGRRPAVDGFLVFRSIASGDSKPAPVQIDIEFGVNGESVNQSTFRAILNNQDVTGNFKVTGAKTMRAVFSLALGSPLQLGRNVLLTSVQGIVPGTKRTATDTDRITFTVVK